VGKVLSRAGVSLADMYNVQGSIAGVEELNSREVQVVHELGTTIFSERFGAGVRRVTTGDLVQSTAWDLVITGLAATPASRIMGVAVLADVPARTNMAQVSVRDPFDGRELPIWVWDSTTDQFVDIRIVDNGAAAANIQYLQPTQRSYTLPALLVRAVPSPVSGLPEVAFRGQTSAFGAGTVEHILLFTTAQAITGRVPSSEGLPIPSW